MTSGDAGNDRRPTRLAVIATHPVQYYAPIYRALAQHPDVEPEVLFAQRQDAAGQARAGFGLEFEWDVPLLDGYRYRFLVNRARRPDVSGFWGCDTPELGAIIRTRAYDAVMVHGWYSRAYWQAMRACWHSQTALLVRGDSHLETPRPRWKKWLKEICYRRFIPRFDAYLWVGRRARDYYLHYGADPARMYFSPHCVDNEFFIAGAAACRAQRQAIRAAFGIPPESTCFLFAGKLSEVKRPRDFLRAIAAAAGQASVCGLVVGDGPLRTELEGEARESGVPVRFAGFLNQTEMPRAYAAADAIVLPGHETWGLVVNEAMASGLPAIVSEAAGCGPDLVQPGETGSIFPCGDVNTLASEMRKLARDTRVLATMGVAARGRVAAYSVQQAVAGVVDGARAAIERRRAER
jgi:glycosyltransferase involved in cell wall biosynthesis